MRVIVTGGTGFLGATLVRRLSRNGHDPVALVRETSPTQTLPEDVESVVGDITDPSSLQSVFKKGDFDGVAHLATVAGRSHPASISGELNWETARTVNVRGSVNVFDAADAANVDTLVFISTLQAHPDIPRADDANYIQSKVKAEERLLSGDYSFDSTIVYPATILGPNDYRLRNYVPFQLVSSTVMIAPPMFVPQTRNYVHVETVSSAIEHGLEGTESLRYLLTGENIEYAQYHRLIADVLDTRCHVLSPPFGNRWIPWVLDRLHERNLSPITGDAINWSASGGVESKFENRQPFDSYSIRDTVEDTASWYQEMGLL